MKKLVDLRSDTVTKPTKAMLEVMMNAEVGDDVYKEDPTVNKLEEKVADLLGKEAALFVPSGTMANQIAIHLHCHPGETVLIEQDSHCYIFEAGAGAALSGVQFDQISWEDDFSYEAIIKSIKPQSLHTASTKLVVVENTHNTRGGVAKNKQKLDQITSAARKFGLATHCDGARIWNAAVAVQESEKQLAANFDSVAVCFSKGLGAPIGSAIVGDGSFIDRAKKIRKRFGGAMRQAGYLAAAAIYALDHHRQRLAEDHERANLFAKGLRELAVNYPIDIKVPGIITNMVYFKIGDNPEKLINALKAQGILLHYMGRGYIRAVTHLHITDEDILYTLEQITKLLKNKLTLM